MRCFVGFVLALAASPLGVSAQGTDKGRVEEFYPELATREPPEPPPREPASEPTPDETAAEPTTEAPVIEATPQEPALQLKLDDAGVEVAPPDDVAERSLFSSELRFQLTANAYRWSSYVPERSGLPDYGKRSLHFTFGLGARFYPKSAHGVLLDFEYRSDPDFDSPPGPWWFCSFDCPPDLWLSTYFTLAHVGYAYRHVVPGPRDPKRLAWAFTPHASLSAGSSETEPSSDTSSDFIVARSRSPVVGARFGLDVDLHIKRFFMGWTLGYEILKHTSGPLRVSHFMNFNVIPVIGAVLGAKVQTQNP